MRDALIIFSAIILAFAIGGYLFIYGGPEFNGQGTEDVPADTSLVVIAKGQQSGSIERRTNIRVTSDEELRDLWSMVYQEAGNTIPAIDFNKYEVIAVFDGTHSSGGYDITVTNVTDGDGVRTVYIRHSEPGSDCVVTDAITSPFEVVRVPKTVLPISKQESLVTKECR